MPADMLSAMGCGDWIWRARQGWELWFRNFTTFTELGQLLMRSRITGGACWLSTLICSCLACHHAQEAVNIQSTEHWGGEMDPATLRTLLEGGVSPASITWEDERRTISRTYSAGEDIRFGLPATSRRERKRNVFSVAELTRA